MLKFSSFLFFPLCVLAPPKHTRSSCHQNGKSIWNVSSRIRGMMKNACTVTGYVCVSEYLYREIIWNLKEIPRQITHPILSFFFRLLTHTHFPFLFFLFFYLYSLLLFSFSGLVLFFVYFFFFIIFIVQMVFPQLDFFFPHFHLFFFLFACSCFSSSSSLFLLARMRRIFEIICI